MDNITVTFPEGVIASFMIRPQYPKLAQCINLFDLTVINTGELNKDRTELDLIMKKMNSPSQNAFTLDHIMRNLRHELFSTSN